MKHIFIISLVSLSMVFALSACGGKTTEETDAADNGTPSVAEPLQLQDIGNRTNLGEKLFITPQPALMIGTYDE